MMDEAVEQNQIAIVNCYCTFQKCVAVTCELLRNSESLPEQLFGSVLNKLRNQHIYLLLSFKTLVVHVKKG